MDWSKTLAEQTWNGFSQGGGQGQREDGWKWPQMGCYQAQLDGYGVPRAD
ncbi:hypothetical protein Z950_1466 [Sulfitobacter mediterraneus KCTC 32188]|nr:hypothetical protein Z950_1466 [Sulfitobacter mediterraneus KCTC 32188]